MRLDEFCVVFAKRWIISVVRHKPVSILAFYQMSYFMQQYKYARFSGVWTKATNGRHARLCGKHLGLQKRTANIYYRGIEQTICAMVFCLTKISEGARHHNPDSAVAKQADFKTRS